MGLEADEQTSGKRYEKLIISEFQIFDKRIKLLPYNLNHFPQLKLWWQLLLFLFFFFELLGQLAIAITFQFGFILVFAKHTRNILLIDPEINQDNRLSK